MKIRFHFQEIREADKKQLEKYLTEKKMSRLTRLLQHGNLALAKFILNAKYHERQNIYLVNLGLKISKNDFIAEKEGHTLLEAFDLAFDRLINQLRKLESKIHDK